jgi:hypothetical protein
MTQGTTPPGWYDDGQGAQRWWDGNGWTDHTVPAGAPTPTGPPGGSAGSPAVHEEPTRFPGTPQAPQSPQTPQTPQAPEPPASADVTRIAPAGGYGAPGQQGSPYGAPAGQGSPYGAPAGQQGSPYGAPAGSPYGAPGGGSSYGAPGQPAWQQSGYPPAGGSGGGKGKLIAIVGGAVALLVIAVVVLVVVLGGGDDPESVDEDSSPGDVVEAYYNGIRNEDCAAVDLHSESFSETIGTREDCEENTDEFFSGDNLPGCELEVTNEEENGDEASVDYEVTGCEDSDDDETGTINLVREGGEWKVDGFEAG